LHRIPQGVDLLLNVNVEFMLCPTAAMLTIFPLLPAWVLWPSYRSTLTLVVIVVGTLISYFYVAVAALLRKVSGGAKASAKKVL
jgi:hypothetical protein